MARYLSRISGPLLDRIGIHVEVPSVPFQHLTAKSRGTDTATGWSQPGLARPNACLSTRDLDRHAVLDDGGQQLVRQAMTELGLRVRAYDKIRRVPRTIADLDGGETVQMDHVAEAIQYRLLDRRM